MSVNLDWKPTTKSFSAYNVRCINRTATEIKPLHINFIWFCSNSCIDDEIYKICISNTQCPGLGLLVVCHCHTMWPMWDCDSYLWLCAKVYCCYVCQHVGVGKRFLRSLYVSVEHWIWQPASSTTVLVSTVSDHCDFTGATLLVLRKKVLN